MMNQNEPKRVPNNDKSDRFLSLSSTANKLEALHSDLESVSDLFATPLVKLHAKLCDDCLDFFSNDCHPFKLDQFRKAEELAWKRVYHDVYRFQKTKRDRVGEGSDCLLESHFTAGIGFYSTLIVKLRIKYQIPQAIGLPEPMNFRLSPIDVFFTDGRNRNDKVNDSDIADDLACVTNPAREWASQAI